MKKFCAMQWMTIRRLYGILCSQAFIQRRESLVQVTPTTRCAHPWRTRDTHGNQSISDLAKSARNRPFPANVYLIHQYGAGAHWPFCLAALQTAGLQKGRT
jgi:hypothetical protein